MQARIPNSSVIVPSDGDTALTYALQTNPDPLVVNLQTASLQFLITNITGSPQTVTSIVFNIPTTVATNLNNNNKAWSDQTNWTVTVAPSSGNVTIQPVNTSYQLSNGASLALQLFGLTTVTSSQNSNITITETLSGQPANNGVFQVSTFPTSFYFNNLSALVKNGSNWEPVAEVASGSTVTLFWNTSVRDASKITIYYSSPISGQQQTSPVTNANEQWQWTSPKLYRDTTFTVVVKGQVNNGQPLHLSQSTSVIVSGSNIPKGTILMWGGNTTDIPTGYALCDGQNGTPDLREKFVYGAGTQTEGTYPTGGSNTAILVPDNIPEITGSQSHTHPVNITSQPHSHPYWHATFDLETTRWSNNMASTGSGIGLWQEPNPINTQSESVQVIGTTESSTVTITVGNSIPAPISTIPQYISLAFIQKVT